jgi:membrane associated rhomboid family serine protease
MAFPSRSAREPVFNLPLVVLIAILGLLAIHAVREWILSDAADLTLLIDYAVIPVRWTAAYGSRSAEAILAEIGDPAASELQWFRFELARHVMAEGEGKPWSGFTYALLHGSWGHVVMNSVWLAALGTPVARRCGVWRFGAMAVATAFGGALAHVLLHPVEATPMIGASAVVSGLMAAAAWFLFARPTRLPSGRIAEPHERPRESFLRMAADRRVLLFLGVWFGANLLFAIAAQPLGITDASIAWEAHVGGFVTGLLLFPRLDPLPRRFDP